MSPILSWFDLNKAIVKPHPSKKATFKNDITDLNPHQKKTKPMRENYKPLW